MALIKTKHWSVLAKAGLTGTADSVEAAAVGSPDLIAGAAGAGVCSSSAMASANLRARTSEGRTPGARIVPSSNGTFWGSTGGKPSSWVNRPIHPSSMSSSSQPPWRRARKCSSRSQHPDHWARLETQLPCLPFQQPPRCASRRSFVGPGTSLASRRPTRPQIPEGLYQQQGRHPIKFTTCGERCGNKILSDTSNKSSSASVGILA